MWHDVVFICFEGTFRIHFIVSKSHWRKRCSIVRSVSFCILLESILINRVFSWKAMILTLKIALCFMQLLFCYNGLLWMSLCQGRKQVFRGLNQPLPWEAWAREARVHLGHNSVMPCAGISSLETFHLRLPELVAAWAWFKSQVQNRWCYTLVLEKSFMYASV